MVEAPGGNAPDGQLGQCGHVDVRVLGVLRLQHHASAGDAQALDRQFPVQDGDHHGPVPGLEGTVDDQFVPVADAGTLHGIPRHPDHEGAGDVLDQVRVQVDPAVEVVLCRRRKARRHRDRGNQHREQRGARVYHAGTDNNAHNTPLFENMFDSFSVAPATDIGHPAESSEPGALPAWGNRPDDAGQTPRRLAGCGWLQAILTERSSDTTEKSATAPSGPFTPAVTPASNWCLSPAARPAGCTRSKSSWATPAA